MLKLTSVPQHLLSHLEFERQYGGALKDFALIRKFAKEHHLVVVRESPARRSTMLSGTVANLNNAFGVSLEIYNYGGGSYRGRVGPVHVPGELAGVVEGVFGLDNRPEVRRHKLRSSESSSSSKGGRAFLPPQIAKLYNFPKDVDGTGQTIGIIELGGGYRPHDLDTYFRDLHLKPPTVVPVSVNGATNSPTTLDSDDGEVVLDIEVAGAVAPGAKIVVYFAPADKTSKGLLDALSKAIHDTEHNPSVISLSWGGTEAIPSTSFQTQIHQELQAAAMLGITVCVSAGDNGAADMGPKVWDGKPHVDFPASSPFALACGGTRLTAAKGSISAESVWNQHKADLSLQAGRDGSFGSSGGGVSGAFPLPPYQQRADVPRASNRHAFKGRGVPDVAGNAARETGYTVLIDGSSLAIGGCSAVAPLWAALIARINQKLKGRVGFLNPRLYALSDHDRVFRDITRGNNRVTYERFRDVGFDARVGWDACSGLGSVDGTELADALMVHVPRADNLVAEGSRKRTARKGSRA